MTKTETGCLNTDREIYRETKGDYYADSIHITKEGLIGMNCGGYVIEMPIRKWFEAAKQQTKTGNCLPDALQTVGYPFQGKRVELIPQQGGFQLLNPGEYGKWKDGAWYGCAPDGSGCNLANHQVIEHEDGTITVSPSISIGTAPNYDWHGYLERGIWRLA